MRVTIFYLGLIELAVASCAPHNLPRKMGDCWNINMTETGRVEGRGLFTLSYEGMSLQSPSCNDSQGNNKFELRPKAEQELRAFKGRTTNEQPSHVLYFEFNGSIESSNGKKVLLIENIGQLRYADRPEWMKI